MPSEEFKQTMNRLMILSVSSIVLCTDETISAAKHRVNGQGSMAHGHIKSKVDMKVGVKT